MVSFQCDSNYVLLPGNVQYEEITRTTKGMFLYSAVSSQLDHSKRVTLHPLADMFIPTLTRLLWQAFSHAAVTVQRLFTHIPSVYSQVLTCIAE